MGVYIVYNKLVITAEPRTFHFDTNKNLEHEIYSIIMNIMNF